MANGYVRYGNSIHLDGFQILDFCIENAISLESLRDLNLGRKVFLTGNDTNAGYLRENVWDGTKWRAAAYLDDLTAFKDEDFNALKEKVDTLIGDGVDMDGIIESWKEVEAFLAGISDTKDLVTLLDGKLNKTGGTIYSDGVNRPLTIKSPSGYVGIGYKIGDTGAGYLVYYGGLDWRVTNENYQSERFIIHSGNIGSYKAGDAAKLNGKEACYYMYSFMLSTGTDLNTNLVSEARPYIATLYDSIHPNQPDSKLANGNILHIASPSAQTAWELIAGFGSSSPLMFRCGTWKADGTGSINTRDWKTIAFTDSTVAAAKRLVDSNNSAVVHIGESGFYVGDNTYKTLSTSLMGNSILFRTGSSAQTAMTITDGGNVLVGTTETKDTKLKVGGRTHIVGFELSEVTTLDNEPSSGLKIGSEGVALYQFMDLNGKGYIQAARFGANPYLFALNLNPLGGAVNVGEGGLNVNGTIKSGDKFLLTTTSMNLGSATTPLYLFLARPDANFIWASANGGYINLGVYDTGTTNAANATLSIYSDRVVSGQRNNAVSLGTSSYRWSNVYSTLGNFSGRVLIGGATDDGSTALQVNGAGVFNNTIIADKYNGQGNIAGAAIVINKSGRRFGIGASSDNITSISLGLVSDKYGTWSSEHIIIESSGLATFNGGALIPTGQKLTIGSVTFEEDAAGRVKVDGDMYTTGTLASGGKAKEGTGTGSGSANVRDFELPADGKTTYDCDHLLKSKNVIVQVFEKALQNNIEVWEMILTDVTIVTEDRVTVTFGRPHNKVHRVHIIGGNVS